MKSWTANRQFNFTLELACKISSSHSDVQSRRIRHDEEIDTRQSRPCAITHLVLRSVRYLARLTLIEGIFHHLHPVPDATISRKREAAFVHRQSDLLLCPHPPRLFSRTKQESFPEIYEAHRRHPCTEYLRRDSYAQMKDLNGHKVQVLCLRLRNRRIPLSEDNVYNPPRAMVRRVDWPAMMIMGKKQA